MAVKISIAALAVLTWLCSTSASVSNTGQQTFNSEDLKDNIAQEQQYKQVIVYLTPSQIHALQQTQEQHGLILPSTTSAPEPLNERERQDYFYLNKNQQNQESNDQAQYVYSSLKEGLSSYDVTERNFDADKQEDYGTDIPVAKSAYEYKDKNSYIYNQFRTVLSPEQDEKYVAPKLKKPFDRSGKETKNNQQEEYTNPQTQTSAISPAVLKQLQKLLQQENINTNAQRFQESDSSTNKQKSVSDFEQSNNNQKKYNNSNVLSFLFPNSKVQVSLSEQPDLPTRQQEPLRVALNLDHETQLLFKNKYQLIPVNAESKDRFEHKLTLEEFLNLMAPENVNVHDTQSQTQNTKSSKPQNVPNSNEQNLSAETKKFLDSIKWINLGTQTKAEEVSELSPSAIRDDVKITKQTPFQRINNQTVAIPVWWPVSTATEDPQDNIKPLGLSASLTHPEKKVLDKKVADDLGKHYSAIVKQNSADSFSSFHRDTPATETNDSANKEGVKKERKLTIINHVWTE